MSLKNLSSIIRVQTTAAKGIKETENKKDDPKPKEFGKVLKETLEAGKGHEEALFEGITLISKEVLNPAKAKDTIDAFFKELSDGGDPHLIKALKELRKAASDKPTPDMKKLFRDFLDTSPQAKIEKLINSLSLEGKDNEDLKNKLEIAKSFINGSQIDANSTMTGLKLIAELYLNPDNGKEDNKTLRKQIEKEIDEIGSSYYDEDNPRKPIPKVVTNIGDLVKIVEKKPRSKELEQFFQSIFHGSYDTRQIKLIKEFNGNEVFGKHLQNKLKDYSSSSPRFYDMLLGSLKTVGEWYVNPKDKKAEEVINNFLNELDLPDNDHRHLGATLRVMVSELRENSKDDSIHKFFNEFIKMSPTAEQTKVLNSFLKK